jgi:DNA-binding MarR family transcriptional regulator
MVSDESAPLSRVTDRDDPPTLTEDAEFLIEKMLTPPLVTSLPTEIRAQLVLLTDGPCCGQELADRIDVSDKTIYRALGVLREAGTVKREIDPTDTRKRIYTAVPPDA